MTITTPNGPSPAEPPSSGWSSADDALRSDPLETGHLGLAVEVARDASDPGPGREASDRSAGPVGRDRAGDVGSSRLTAVEAAIMAMAFLVGLVQRWQVVNGPLGYIDLDEATAGIAARNFFSHPHVFFPAQPYGGTPETVLVGVVHQIFGSGPLQLKVMATLLHLVACGFVWGAARRIVPNRGGQLAAPVLLWLGPAVSVWESTKERGFYGAAIVTAAALIWLAARLDERETARDVIAFGICVGFGWWISPLLMLVAVPATVWLLVRDPGRLNLGLVVAPAAAVGALPWIGWNVLHGFASLRQPPDLGTSLFTRFGDGLGKLAVLTGLETPWNAHRVLVPGARVLGVALVLAAVMVSLLRHPSSGASLAGTLVVGYLLMYPLANNTGTVGADPRYLYPLLPALALAMACLVPAARAPVPVAARAAVVVVLTAALATWGLVGLDEVRTNDVRFLEAPGTTQVIRLLEDRGITFVTSDLAGTQITYATAGRIKASSFAVPRFPALERLTAVRQPSTYVIDDALAGNSSKLEWYLATHHIPYERHRIGVWTVVLIDRWVPPWEAKLATLRGIVERPSA